MALEVVGGAFLSASLQVLFADIHSIVDFFRRNEVDEEQLRNLRNKLLLANEVLNVAEKKQITNRYVRNCLENLRDAIHNAEDLVDDIKTEADRQILVDDIKTEADCQMGSQVSGFFSSIQRGIQNIIESVDVQSMIQNIIKSADVERRIQNIIKSVDETVELMKCLGLRKDVQTTMPFQIRRSSLNILAKKSDVYGRDAEKETIINFLKSDGGHKFSVMPIVGMGGIGKTTLAQLVYRDVRTGKVAMEKPFVIQAWITVADEFKCDAFTLTKAIYEKVTKSTWTNVEEPFLLQLELEEALQGKKFLFILDDVWNVDYETWIGLQTPFESAADGSKIIVTTRLPKIAEVLGAAGSEVLDLKLLSKDDGWKLFSKHAFNNVDPSSYPDLEVIGRKIVEKCKGNPLAVKSLGCLLHSRLNPKEWETVLVNDIWELEEREGGIREGGILPALWLSYYYLPRHLKPCFAYCSIIPKDYEFEKKQLILLWMAQGLLQPQNNMMLEEVGEKYFEDLASRSFFLVDRGNTFTMHDLVNDLAKYVSGEFCLRLDDNCYGNLTRKTRHISLMNYVTSDISKKLEDLSKNTVLRTLFLLKDCIQLRTQHFLDQLRSMQCQYLRVLSFRLHPDFEGQMKLLESLKHLRYLDLSRSDGIEEIPDSIGKLCNLQTLLLRLCRIHELPESIANLKHLRYLDLSDTLIKTIPDTLGNLHELLTLDLSGTGIEKIPDTLGNLHELRTLELVYCEKFTQLPTNITMLTNLCDLNNLGTSLKVMPPKLSNLKNLRRLQLFVVGKSCGIEELGKLTNLHGLLHIRSLENVDEVEDVSKANLKNKNHITDLELEWNDDSADVPHNKAREVLDRLHPHSNIQRLNVNNYGGRSFPDWMGHHSFSCIKDLRLYRCKNCGLLPPLGELPSLECLVIEGFDTVERIGDEFYLSDSSTSSRATEPPFKSLKSLVFGNMAEWKEWSLVGGAFPILESLKLRGCPKLKGVGSPDYLPSLNVIDKDVISSLRTATSGIWERSPPLHP
ncbi:hypothetical protein FNV43_RR15293 [Rhamnella rubrinervis]|uniref:Disease resistance RPP13-like protein 1 n=1 Tax=Rhamnella rubrinervis TaxID=2594499 RepID=A0A8K0E8M9_9ROSA|nr:hypothetical protein FNV43_RR15293 [Rhamnella rubrinervis]